MIMYGFLSFHSFYVGQISPSTIHLSLSPPLTIYKRRDEKEKLVMIAGDKSLQDVNIKNHFFKHITKQD